MSLVINAQSCVISGPRNLSCAYEFLRKNLLKQKHLSRSMALNNLSNLKSLDFLLDKKVFSSLMKNALTLLHKQERTLGLLEDDTNKIIDLVSTFDKEDLKINSNHEDRESQINYLWARVTYHKSKFSRDPYFDLCHRLSCEILLSARTAKFGTLPDLLCTLKSSLYLPGVREILSLLEPLSGNSIDQLNLDELLRVTNKISDSRSIISSVIHQLSNYTTYFSEQQLVVRESMFRSHEHNLIDPNTKPLKSHCKSLSSEKDHLFDYSVSIVCQQGAHSTQSFSQALHA